MSKLPRRILPDRLYEITHKTFQARYFFDRAIKMFEEASSSSDVVGGREEREFETLEDWAVGKERFSVYDISTACCAQCRRQGRRAQASAFCTVVRWGLRC